MSTSDNRDEKRSFVSAGSNGAFIARGEVIIEEGARDALLAIAEEQNFRPSEQGEFTAGSRTFLRFGQIPRPLEVVERLTAEGFSAQPNHGFSFHGTTAADSGGCCCGPCGPHPSGQFAAQPFMSHPFMSHPFMSHPFMSHAKATNTAVPGKAPAHVPDASDALAWNPKPSVVVMDSGIAASRPAYMMAPATITGVTDVPDDAYDDLDGTKVPPDGILDPVAGHGTFIAGVIQQLAPGAEISVSDLSNGAGVVTETELIAAIEDLVKSEPPTFLSMSIGGPVVTNPVALHSAIAAVAAAGVVIVASAGNSATCEPFFPAAFPEVIGVGALGPSGPAPFTNYGSWVDAAAPAVDRTSAFFDGLAGLTSLQPGVDVADFEGWAIWSGTSFAVPVVIAALLREMALHGLDATQAVDRVIRAPHLLRLPGVGVVVNL